MTIKKYAGDKVTGLSTDTKPTNVPDGGTYFELDTSKVFVKYSSSWVQTNANNTSFVGSVSAANVVSNAQLSANLSNYATTSSLSSYQTTAGLSANVSTLTSNNTSFVGSVSAANVVSNSQLTANLANYQTSAGLSANVARLTANNSTYLNDVAAASYVQNTDSRTLSGNLTFSSYLITGIGTSSMLKIGKAEEGFTSYNNVNGSFTFDCTNGNIFYASSACSSFTPVLSNFTCENTYGVGITLIINQGSSAYIPTSNLNIGGSNVTVSWQGGSAPSGTANKKDVVSYSILNLSGTYTVLGQLTSFG